MEEPVTHDRLRRAYLRRLRAHPPERDPDGFRRLREAFEQLEPWARMHDRMQAASAEPEPFGAPADRSHPPARAEAPPHLAEPAEASATAPGTASTETLEHAAAIARPEDPAERRSPPRDDPPGVAHESDASESDAGEPDASEPEAEPTPAADPSPTLRDVTEDILARLEAGELDAARALADHGNHSVVDDHREVSPDDVQRWALTRELLDVAPSLPGALRRAIARGIATDNLAEECTDVDVYQSLSSVQAVGLARRLGRQAPNLFKVIARPMEASIGARNTPSRSWWSGRGAIWSAVVIVVALLRLVHGCDPTPHNRGFNDIPAQGLQLDPEVVRRLEQQSHPPAGAPDPNQRLEFKPLGPMVPSQP